MTLRLFLLLFLYIGITPGSNGQIHPAESSKLHYIIVGFRVPANENAKHYEFKVAKGHFTDEEQFAKNIILIEKSDSNKAVLRLPSFGTAYTWQVLYHEGKKNYKSELHHFWTDTSSFVDKEKFRLRVLTNKYPDTSLLFFLDYSRVLFDMHGEPVWFLPNIPPYVNQDTRLRDMKMTPDGTITFLINAGLMEVDYNANVIWKITEEVSEFGKGEQNRGASQRGGRSGLNRYYHHEITKLKNGHYLCMGNEQVRKKLPYLDSNILKNEWGVEKEGNEYYKNIEMGILFEMDTNGKPLWEWKASDYFTDKDIFLSFKSGSMYNTTTHMNAFYFDGIDSSVYVGFRDISTILKIKYPEGSVSEVYKGLDKNLRTKYFSMQHSIGRTQDGQLYIFNNNVDPINETKGAVSSILVLDEPARKGDSLRVAWEYKCNIDELAPHAGLRGGNTAELGDGSFLTCMGTSPRIFIVDKKKKILFNSLSEKWDESKNLWVEYPQYRVCPITQENFKLMVRF